MSFFVTRSVFFRSIATVIGPTPPGTGVIKAAFFFTSKRKEKKALTMNVSKPFFPSYIRRAVTGRYCREETSKGRALLQPRQGRNTARTGAARYVSQSDCITQG